MSPTVLREKGYRFFFFSKEEPRCHILVENAPVAILNVEEPRRGHYYWPDLDVDLTEEIIEHPERFPLVARAK